MQFSDDEIKEMRSILYNYINDNCIIRRPPGDRNFVLLTHSGDRYIWQFYLRKMLFNSKFLTYTGMLFWSKYAEEFKKSPFQIAGLETGSTPLIVGLAMTAPSFGINVNAFSIRKDRKTYGTLNRMEGIVTDEPVMLVDDLCNSKNTMFLAKKYCEEEDLKIYNKAFTVVNKNILKTDSTEFDKYIGETLPVDSLFYINEFDLEYLDYFDKKNNIGE